LKEFWEDLNEVQGEDSLVTKGGLKIHFSRRELEEHFGLLLDKRPLETLVGETAYWLLIPALVSIYSFPIMLYISRNMFYSIMASVGLMMSTSLFNQFSYNYAVNNYLVKPAVHPIAKLLINFIFAVLLYRAEESLWYVITPFIWWILNDRIPIIYLVSELLMIKFKQWMYNLGDPDGVLRQAGIYWAKKYDLEATKSGKILGVKNTNPPGK